LTWHLTFLEPSSPFDSITSATIEQTISWKWDCRLKITVLDFVQPSGSLDHLKQRADQAVSQQETTKGLSMAISAKSQKNAYRSLLLKKRQEIMDYARHGPEALAMNVQSADDVEVAVGTLAQHVTAAATDLRSRELREIENALRRIAGGTYGECEGCGEPISPARLKALPWARFCLSCQENLSRN
jgi:DnaK suppressor protein